MAWQSKVYTNDNIEYDKSVIPDIDCDKYSSNLA